MSSSATPPPQPTSSRGSKGNWWNGYSTEILSADVSAGLTTAVMLIPQGMAYAMLAGLPPIMGLYASTIPLFVYALVGSSRQLSVGPMAMASLLVAGGVQELVPADQITPDLAISMALLLTVLAGVFQIALAAFRLGGLVNLLSHPVVTGFTSAAALIIGASQLQHVVGFPVPRGLGVPQTVWYVITNIDTAHWLSMAIGLLGCAVIVGLKRTAPKLPAALIAVVIATSMSWLFAFDTLGVKVLGEIPRGLPSPSIPSWDLATIQAAAPMGLTVALIGFMESISAAKIYARQNRYDLSATRELVGLGLANMSAGLFGGYTVGGALSRTAVNAEAGAKTPLANVVTGLAIIITLLLLTPLFYYLPTPILASIILVAVTGLLDFQEWKHLWEVKRDDLGLLLITFFATLFLSIEAGIVVGVLASLLWLVYTTTRPEIASLGRVPETRSYRSLAHFPNAETVPRVLILRMDAQFFFGNVAHLKDTLLKRLDGVKDPVALVIDCSSMNGLDSTAADTFGELIGELRRTGVEVFVSHVKGSVLGTMTKTGLVELLGEGHMHYEVDDAVNVAILHREAVEAGVPEEEEDLGPSDLID